MQQAPATLGQHSDLKTLALKVLARNIAARPLGNSGAERGLHSAATQAGALQHVSHGLARTQTPAVCEPELSPLGRSNGRGELVLTLEDLPELERRLRLSGWRVERRRSELLCTSRKAHVQ